MSSPAGRPAGQRPAGTSSRSLAPDLLKPASTDKHEAAAAPAGIVPIDTLLLGRTDQVAVAVTGLPAFSAGIEIFVTAARG
jgi:hypothetical protein